MVKAGKHEPSLEGMMLCIISMLYQMKQGCPQCHFTGINQHAENCAIGMLQNQYRMQLESLPYLEENK